MDVCLKEIKSDNLKKTQQIGSKLGHNLKGGEVIVLNGDLGSGKTTLTASIAKGAGSLDQVNSPSFLVKNQYSCPRFIIHHFDFFRLNDPGLMKNELIEIINNGQDVIVIEWAQIIKDLMIKDYLTIDFKIEDYDSRKLSFRCSPNLKYLINLI